jgi:hypothetical protein
VDPTNRFVADQLEADWNNKLRELADAKDEYERATHAGNRRSPTNNKRESARSPPTSPRSGETRPPRSANASG